MKFAHLADIHIGAWREPKLNEISTQSFVKSIDICINEKVDFVLIAGDLFNTPIPSIDMLNIVVEKLKELKENGIRVYGIPGSHDFSPSGKTMINVLSSAGLFTNVCKGQVNSEGKLELDFTIDKSGAKITGVIGKKGMLDREIYKNLELSKLEEESGFKIFVFHTLINELKPKDLEKMDSQEMSYLPKGFSYYAGGHPHIVENCKLEGYGRVCYTGPLFPNNFSEIEKLGHGGFYIYDEEPRFVPIKIKDVENIEIDCNHKVPEQVDALLDLLDVDVEGKIVTIRAKGVLESGKVSEIDFKKLVERFNSEGAYFVMKNSNQLTSKDFQEIRVETGSASDVEDKIIKEHVGEIELEGFDVAQLTKNLMNAFSTEKREGEKVADFEKRVLDDVKRIF